MVDAFRSALIFYRAHKGTVALLVTTLSFIFFVCLILHSLTLKSNNEIDTYRSDIYRTYVVFYEPANQEITEDLINSLYQAKYPIEELNVCGEVEVKNNDIQTLTARDDEAIPSLAKDNATGTDETTVAFAKFPLIGFDQTSGKQIDIIRGSNEIGIEDVLVDAWTYQYLVDYITSDSETHDSIQLANGVTREINGVVSIRSWRDYGGIIVDRDSFFSMTSTSTSIQIIFAAPLSLAQENQWIKEASDIVTIIDISAPSDNLQSTREESSILLVLSRIIIVICLLCAMRLMTYLFLLRKQELSVLRLVGASSERISMYIVAMIFEISCFSILIGSLGYFLLFLFQVIESFLCPLSLDQIGSDILFFVVATLMTGFSMFVLNNKVDVIKAIEEV